MDYRVVWIHGIGPHQPGYSSQWQTTFNRHLNLSPADYLEVCWDTVFDAAQGATRSLDGSGPVVALTPEEQLAEQKVRQELETLLQARASAIQESALSSTRSGGDVESYDDLQGSAATRGYFDWLFNPDEYIGDFAKYLVSRNLRTAVKEKAKEQLRTLAGRDVAISIIAHSWGTVVGYDALLDLEIEVPSLRVAHFFTLGSPLWAVRRMLEDSSGRKPGLLSAWVNVHARGDLIGSWLRPAFRTDRDLRVPKVGGAGAHSSYFVDGNDHVQRDIVSAAVLNR